MASFLFVDGLIFVLVVLLLQIERLAMMIKKVGLGVIKFILGFFVFELFAKFCVCNCRVSISWSLQVQEYQLLAVYLTSEAPKEFGHFRWRISST